MVSGRDRFASSRQGVEEHLGLAQVAEHDSQLPALGIVSTRWCDRGRWSPRVVRWRALVGAGREAARHGVASMPRTLGRGDAAILTKIAWGYNEALRVDRRP
jgi:hypothetical protein